MGIFSKEDIAERLEKFLNNSNLSKKDFALRGNIDPKTLTNILAKSSTPNAKALHGWSENLDLNPDWILTGREPMLLDLEEPTKAEESKEVSSGLAQRVALAETGIKAVDPDATEAEVLDQVIKALILRRRKLDPNTYGYDHGGTEAREASWREGSLHESSKPYAADACGIDGRGLERENQGQERGPAKR